MSGCSLADSTMGSSVNVLARFVCAMLNRGVTKASPVAIATTRLRWVRNLVSMAFTVNI
jgi:hypothetical protein